MPVIKLQTYINAVPSVVFNLSRSIDLHVQSTAQTKEKAIAGVTSGLIGLGETVTWRARHFGLWLTLTSKITAMAEPLSFTDEMVTGPFKSMKHEHHFKADGNGTVMTDVFAYQNPLGILGRLADWIFLRKYMTGFLEQRNACIKQVAETAQ